VKVKGNTIKSRIAFVKARFGEAAWEKVLSSLPAHDQSELRNVVLNVAWFPFELGKRLDRAIVEVVGGGDARIFEEMGRASARENLGGVHKNFLDPRDPARFMAKAPLIYRFYYDTGYRTWEPTGPTSGVLTTYEAETFSVPDCATVIGWHKEGLAMAGATDVQIVEESCRVRGDAVCRYRISWS
jgi:hypothetical protein